MRPGAPFQNTEKPTPGTGSRRMGSRERWITSNFSSHGGPSMKRYSAVCLLMTLAAAAPATLGAQTRALSIGSASSAWHGGAFSGFVARGDLVWREPNHFLYWRASGSFTRLGGGIGASGDRLPAAQIYGLSASAVLSPSVYIVRMPPALAHVAYVAAGPGLYGYRSLTEYRLGWHLGAGLQAPVGEWTLFGEAMGTVLGSNASTTGFSGMLRSVSIGIRR